MRRTPISRKAPARALNDRPHMKFEVDEYALADPDLHEEVLEVLSSVPFAQQRRMYWALQLALAAVRMERCRILDQLKGRMAPPAAAQRA